MRVILLGAILLLGCVPSADALPLDLATCPVDEEQAEACLYTYGGPDEGCLELWLLGEFRGSCWTLPVPWP